MRRGADARIRRWWRGEAGAAGRILSALALPAELLFRGLVRLRNAAYDRRWFRSVPPPIPVVSVGNLSVGGTGKTPLTARLLEVLQAAGHRPSVVARGYGEDELALHRRWNPGVPVIADPDRVRGVAAAAREGADVAVLDDGFQHRGLGRDLDLVLVAAEQPWPVRLLPRGPYREPLASLRRAGLAVVTRRTAGPETAGAWEARIRARHPRLGVARVALVADGWLDLDGRPGPPPAGAVVAVAGVAGPDAFAEMVRAALQRPVDLLEFPDHHAFRAQDVDAIRRRAEGRTLVTTEKDAVRLVAWRERLPPVRVLRLGVRFEAGEAALLDAVERAAEHRVESRQDPEVARMKGRRGTSA